MGRPPPRFTLTQWHLTTRDHCRNADDQQQLADRILAESERVIEEAEETVLKNKKEVEHHINVKIKDIEFLKSLAGAQKKEMDKEVDAMLLYRERIQDAQRALGTRGLDIIRKCLVLRDQRVGIDLCADEVDIELRKECDMILGVHSLLERLLEQVKEQVRRLRAVTYSLVRDLEDKENVLVIDRHNLVLTENSHNLSTYHGSAPLDPANITQEEWIAHSQQIIDDAQKELVSGRPIRAYVDVLLKQVIEDLWKQYDIVNEAFRRRIQEYKDLKEKLENHHFETVRQVNEAGMTIEKLQKAIAEKEGFMALAHTRLGNRCQRSGVELCRDEAETYLVDEVRQIKNVTSLLQQKLVETQAVQRYLLRTQLQIEEDINVKTNSIKIDEVECMSLRRGMDYHAY
ncbi:hypothetical protein AAG570_010192 [Ranatra chinensis]|uniref:Tektin n=1 Tax=Ranatra chinensis TaxID=642074 RepID=A0ABD0YM16_9HEMI